MPTSKPASNKERVLDELRLVKPCNSAGRNLSVVIAVGVVLGAVVIIGLLLGALAQTILITAAVGFVTWEVCERLHKSDWQVFRPVLILSGQLTVWLSTYWGTDGLVMGLTVTLMLLLVTRLPLHGMTEAPRNWLRDVAVGAFAVMWIPSFAALAVQLVHMDSPWGVDPYLVIVTFMIGVTSNDVGGYAAGVMFGKHPMAPKVSPKKSWEGFGGSLALVTTIGALYVIFMSHAPWRQSIVLGVALVISVTLGNLMESQFKRDLGIKDMPSILPGHGGLMDRLGDILPPAVMTWLILQLFSLV